MRILMLVAGVMLIFITGCNSHSVVVPQELISKHIPVMISDLKILQFGLSEPCTEPATRFSNSQLLVIYDFLQSLDIEEQPPWVNDPLQVIYGGLRISLHLESDVNTVEIIVSPPRERIFAYVSVNDQEPRWFRVTREHYDKLLALDSR